MVDKNDDLLPEPAQTLAAYRRKKPMMIGTTKHESALSLGLYEVCRNLY